MQSKEIFKAVLTFGAPVALLAGALVTGCGGGGGVNPNPNGTPTPTPVATATPRPAATQIVYVSTAGSNADLFILGPGGVPERLTSDAANDVQPSFSPDKTKVVFSSTRDGNPEIYVTNAVTQVSQRLTTDSGSTLPVDDSPTYSQAGDRIAWRSTRGGTSNIFYMLATGANQTRLSNEAAGATDPFWHPNGASIGYVTKRGGVPRIVIKNIASGAEQIVALDNGAISNGSISHPRFNRAGDKIVFSSQAPNGASSSLFIINANGSGLQSGPTAGRFNESPVWSNDGTRIIWGASGGVAATPQIYSANPDGSDVQALTNNANANTSPSTGGASG